MEIVFLETISLGDDINLDRFDELGHVTKYRDTPVELVPERVKDADVVVINKIPMNEKTLAGASHLKLVAVTADIRQQRIDASSNRTRQSLRLRCPSIGFKYNGTAVSGIFIRDNNIHLH